MGQDQNCGPSLLSLRPKPFEPNEEEIRRRAYCHNRCPHNLRPLGRLLTPKPYLPFPRRTTLHILPSP